ncbi:tripartite tricarboxylate transporter TctB family protein [Sporomusa acidovorans]|uniref:DUF1468 domain-containing protein n=1 Tax=Sporomusa acidovorans (strain ATCC 49682 / DSM 3132 / Mol) TaxID=1123286 RepID=A0ABZ3J8K4_SPOA4|nr:tripartite tricarboxylate transporter TctB family protein [Sporomusa acidovorans]OZC17499.1 tripartite tricarboxylate transporter TctB family protein [Sporomusa acidovorans DSM 3132]SDF07562.1 Tripartite tricarboxylate transporter TctB family protein [Sporomusa acidovorans]
MSEKLVVIFFLVTTTLYTHFAFQLSFGCLQAPKAGFLPVITGCIAVILAFSLCIATLFKKGGQEAANALNDISWRRLIFLIIGMIGYIILLKLVGYLLATMIILFYLFKVAETEGWFFPCLFSLGIALSFYVIFYELLGTNLP